MNVLFALAEIAGLLIAVAMLVVTFVVCLRVLPKMGFTGASRKILSFCVAALSALGLTQVFPSAPSQGVPPNDSTTYSFLLIPYAALGLSLLVLVLLVFVSRWLNVCRECPSQSARPHLPSQAPPSERPHKAAYRDSQKHGQGRRKGGMLPGGVCSGVGLERGATRGGSDSSYVQGDRQDGVRPL